jgi:hypothetical protein
LPRISVAEPYFEELGWAFESHGRSSYPGATAPGIDLVADPLAILTSRANDLVLRIRTTPPGLLTCLASENRMRAVQCMIAA